MGAPRLSRRRFGAIDVSRPPAVQCIRREPPPPDGRSPEIVISLLRVLTTAMFHVEHALAAGNSRNRPQPLRVTYPGPAALPLPLGGFQCNASRRQLSCSFSLACPIPAAPAQTSTSRGSFTVVFRDGHRQSFNLADIERLEFAAAIPAGLISVPGPTSSANGMSVRETG